MVRLSQHGSVPACAGSVVEIRGGLDEGSGLLAKKTLEQTVSAIDGKPSWRRRNRRGATKRVGRIAE